MLHVTQVGQGIVGIDAVLCKKTGNGAFVPTHRVDNEFFDKIVIGNLLPGQVLFYPVALGGSEQFELSLAAPSEAIGAFEIEIVQVFPELVEVLFRFNFIVTAFKKALFVFQLGIIGQFSHVHALLSSGQTQRLRT